MTENKREPIPHSRKCGTAGRQSYYKKFYCAECGSIVTRYKSSVYDTREGSQWRCNHSFRLVTSSCSAKMFMEKYMDYNFVKTLEKIKKNKKFRQMVEMSISRLELSQDELKDNRMIEEEIEELNLELYKAVDLEVQNNGKDTKLINDITEKIIKLRERQLLYIERLEKLEDEQTRLKSLIKYCEKTQPISFKEFHAMRPRIQIGQSLYQTSNVAKNITYMDSDAEDCFPEEVFSEHVLSATINIAGKIKYKFAEDIEFGLDMTYEDYQMQFEEEKSKIQWEELINSEEILKLKEFCKMPRKPAEIREHLSISSKISYEKRIKIPMVEAGLLEPVDSGYIAKRKYKWVSSEDEIKVD